MHQKTIYAIKILKQYFNQQDIDILYKMCETMRKGNDCPITSVGHSPQDKHMLLKVLSQEQIFTILKKVMSEKPKIFKVRK